jgi:hypothetical protein
MRVVRTRRDRDDATCARSSSPAESTSHLANDRSALACALLGVRAYDFN